MFHLSPVVIAVLVVVAGLILLYLVARKFKKFGHAVAFVCAIAGSVLVTLSYHMAAAAACCHRACETALKSINDTGEWTMRDFLEKLQDFSVGFLVIFGEAVQVTEVLPSMFQAAVVSLPPIFELSSAALFILTSIMFAETAFNAWRGVGLFRGKGKLSRFIVGFLAVVLAVFSCVVNYYFYVYRGKILAHQPVTGMTLYIMGGLGLEVSAVAPFCYLAVKEGSPAVVATLMWFAEKTYQTVHAAATFLPDFLDTLALHLSWGEFGVYRRQVERDPHKYPSLFGSASANLQPGNTRVVELPEHAASMDADTDDDNVQIFPVLTPALEEKMKNNPDCNASILFIGTYGSRLRPSVVAKISELHATGTIRTSAYIDLAVNHIPTSIDGIVDISPTMAERRAATLHGKNEDEIYTLLIDLVAGKLVTAHMPNRHVPGVLIVCIDPSRLVDFANAADAIKRRYPLLSILVVTSISDQDVNNPTIHTGIVDVQSLHSEDIVETCIVTSPRSSFASSYGEQTQLNFTAAALVSLLLSHRHNLISNRSMISVLQELHHLSPFCTLSFASEAVALGDVAGRFKWIPGMSNAAGAHTGDFSDIVLQARNVATRVLTVPDTRAFDAEVSNDTSCMVLFNTPIQLNDPRCNEFSRDMALWVGANFHNVTSTTTVRGNGIALPYHLGGRFLVSASCIYPLSPSSYPRLQPAKSVKVTQLFPLSTALEPVQGNGRVHTDASNETDTKKPASSRKSKTRRVVVRKSNKQAK